MLSRRDIESLRRQRGRRRHDPAASPKMPLPTTIAISCPSSYQPPADAQHLYKYKFTDGKKRSLPNGWAREATVEQFPSPKAWRAST
ncbi:hypothetical protein SL267_21990 [Serratia marcescens]|nr:hypothetical protein [Serratia marcescens]BCZ57582.1 hypothetical protein SL267_21990 [Serratia marcescens]